MRVLSLFSGVGGFDLGLERAGMQTVAQVEWDKKCQSVLARHWPDVPRWGDVSDVRGADLPDCDLVAFGSPCQDLSVAGKRAGMIKGETRSGLFYEAIRIIKELQDDGRGPAWAIWENVGGALSSNGGADFGTVLDSLAELGAVDIQWRILDAQWFGIPQRRRRAFVIARFDPRAAGREQVLPLGARVRRDSAARGEARPGAPASPEDGASGGSATREVTNCLRTSSMNVDDGQAQAGWLVPEVANQLLVRDAKGTPTRIDPGEGNLVPFVKVKRSGVPPHDDDRWRTGEPSPTLNTMDNGSDSRAVVATVTPDLEVRRLTPRECERLMGWPDDWTRWTDDGSEVADSSRYRMCGNGVASPVAEWVGRCILHAERQTA